MSVSDENAALHSLSRRSAMLLGLVLVVAAKPAMSLPGKVPRILFICQYGTAKSAIARELFRRRARQRGVAVTAFSRGITLVDHISPPLRQKLSADGIDPAADHATVLERHDWQHADLVVAFNPLPKQVRPSNLRDWSDLGSLNDDYAHARPDLDRRIAALIDDIAKAYRRPSRR